jgi:hypothetical protein
LHDSRAALVAIPLLISEVPQVRYRTLTAVSPHFLSEIDVVERLITESPFVVIREVLVRWTDLIEERMSIDGANEPLTILVDEFFIIQKCLNALKRPFDLSAYASVSLANARSSIIPILRSIITELHE